MIRAADVADIPELLALENRCFESDRLSARSFRHAIARANATLLVKELRGRIIAYALVFYRRGSPLARLYSFAVDPDHQGKGHGRQLIKVAEEYAFDHGSAYMRLEVRKDNPVALGLYRKDGYRPLGTVPEYYEDKMDAIRLEKALVPHLAPEHNRVPYHAQTLEFTCGPACLMMAMQSIDPTVPGDRMEELRLWRESTTVFMTSGHGGCGPFGLALAAHRRGFSVELYAEADPGMFVDSVRDEEKKQVIRLVQEDLLAEVLRSPIPFRERPLEDHELAAACRAGKAVPTLVSSYRLTGDKAPHWVVVVGGDDRFVYLHDPYVDKDLEQTPADCMGLPVPRADFQKMARYGRAKHHAALVIGPGKSGSRRKRSK